MIFDSIENLALYGSAIPCLSQVLELLESGMHDIPKGSYSTDTPGLRYNVAQYQPTTEPKQYEIHKREIDLQVMLSGDEQILTASRALAKEAGPYDSAGDCMLVDGDSNGSSVLTEGTFAVYYPGEPHKPGLFATQQEVKKVIFKIAL